MEDPWGKDCSGSDSGTIGGPCRKNPKLFSASHPYTKVMYGFKGGFKDLTGKDKSVSLSEDTIGKKSLTLEWGKFSLRLKSILRMKII